MSSEQFLGRQLSQQAIKLGELVEKMQQMIIAQELSIPKYIKSSDELKKTITFGTTTNGRKLLTAGLPLEMFNTYISGVIKIEISIWNASSVTTFNIFKNGNVYIQNLSAAGTTSSKIILELSVKDGDIIQMGGSSALYVESIKVYYSDELDRTEIV